MHLLKVGLRVPAKVRAYQGQSQSQVWMKETCWRLCAVLEKEAHHILESLSFRGQGKPKAEAWQRSQLEEAQMRHLASWQDFFLLC